MAQPHALHALQVAMVAGEASGDLLGALLLQGLKARWPALAAWGIGGPRMAAQGLASHWPMERLSVFGYVDALKRLPELLRIRKALGNQALARRPDVFIGVDAPDFNFGLEQRLKEAGVKTVHFVCPSIWAWRGERVHKLKAAADHVLCLFPFEPPLLAQQGVEASFVGHPLAEVIPMEPPRAAARQALQLAEADTVVALLPGSRHSEMALIGPPLAEAAARLAHARPGLKLLLPAAPGLGAAAQALVAQYFRPQAPAAAELQCLDGNAHAALAACDVALVASGTATLEAALFKRPMVITYRLSWANWQRMKRMRYQPWVGLPNILAQRFVVPELLQHQATPQALADAALAWLDDPARRAALEAEFQRMHLRLRQPTAERAAQALARLLGLAEGAQA